MVLSDKRIRQLMADGLIIGGDEKSIGPASIDIRLGDSFSVIDEKGGTVIKLGNDVTYKTFRSDKFYIYPGQFVLATTMERFDLRGNLAAFVQGRSSIGRIGLTIQNAGFVDPGFRGAITLELVNESHYTIEVFAGYRVGQMVFMETDEVLVPYHGKYNGQVLATGSRMGDDCRG